MTFFMLDLLVITEERDEYDQAFERQREETLLSRRKAIEEELGQAKKKVETCRSSLQKSHEQVSSCLYPFTAV